MVAPPAPAPHHLAEYYASSLSLKDGLLVAAYAVDFGTLTPRQIERVKRVGWRLAASRVGLVWQ